MRRTLSNGEGKPVVALDIDGTMGDYHGHFLWFAEKWLGKPMPSPEDINPGLRLHKFMGVSLRTYRECKLAYRQGGLKRFMPCYPGAAEMVRAVRRAGAEVWVCTTRPHLRLDNIDPDTQEWLKRNGIAYDAILYGEDKYRELYRQVGHRVAAVLEDLPELYREARKLFPEAWVLLRSQPYNRGVWGLSGFPGEIEALDPHDLRAELGIPGDIPDMVSAREVLLDAIQDWKEEIK